MNTEIKNREKPVDTEFRFKFGKNWRNYINNLSEERVILAIESIKELLGVDSLNGKSFVDVGCGSGIFSLAAVKLGAKKVVSIDYDQESVDCARYLNEKYGPFDNWIIQQGSVLNENLIRSLEQYDVVYSWGVLHHTGDMWLALENVSLLVGNNGCLVISIYNDQGWLSKFWTCVKYVYNKSPSPVQLVMGNLFFIVWAILMLLSDLVNHRPIANRYRGINARGMNAYFDAIDWIGGYPFEVATREKIISFYEDKGFDIKKIKPKQGTGCNEFVFKKN